MVKLQVIGHLGKDCLMNTVNGNNVINFTVAHSEKYKDAQGVQKEKTLWVDCAYWTERTGIAPYLKKGTLVYVEGTPDIRTYTTQDGKQGASMTMRISNVQLLGGKNDDQSGGSETRYQSNNQQNDSPALASKPTSAETPEELDDLPF